MLQEALEFLVGIGVKSTKPETLIEHSDKKIMLIDGEQVDVAKEKLLRMHNANNVESFVGYEGENSVIWHSGNRAFMIVDDEDEQRRDSVAWNLKESSKFVSLATQAMKPREHKPFVKFVVKNLRDEFERDVPGLLGTIRNLKFATSDETEADIQHGRASMGRKIEQSVTGATELPETIALNVRRWAGLEIFVEIESLLAVDMDNRTLAIEPLSDSVAQAELDAHKQLGDLLRDNAKCNIYHGSA